MNRRGALACLTGALVAAPQLAASAQPAGITIDRTDGRGRGRRPAVLLLHGADGITRLPQYQFAAAALSAQGFTVFFPHYFEITNERSASYREIGAKYPYWLNGLRGAVTRVLRDPAVDSSRLAIVGVSLGGALALSLAARDRRVKAVVTYFAYQPDDLEAGRTQARTLILHGDSDRIVPVRNAAQIEAMLRAQGASVEKAIYRGEGHGFSQAAQLDAANRTAVFLRKSLVV